MTRQTLLPALGGMRKWQTTLLTLCGMRTRRSLLLTFCALMLSAPLLAQEPSPATNSLEEQLLGQVQAARRHAAHAEFARSAPLDRAAKQRAQTIASSPPNERLKRDRSASSLVRAQGLRHFVRVTERVDQCFGSRNAAREILQRWKASETAWAKVLDPALTRIGLATTRTRDGWIIFVGLLMEPQRVPEDLETWSHEILFRINEIRREHELWPLKPDPQLHAAALAHSRSMAAHDFFAHVSPEGDGPGDRVRRETREFYRVGENISFNLANADPVGTAITGWMNSPRHREHILDPAYGFTGVGVAEAGNGGFYFTQLFLEEAAEAKASQ